MNELAKQNDPRWFACHTEPVRSHLILDYDSRAHANFCAAGVRLDGFLAESEGLSGDFDLRHFATNYQVSSVKSGSGEPPNRAQICSFVWWWCRRLILFFLSRFLDHQNGILSDETRKRTSEKVTLSEYVHRTAPNLGQDQITVWSKQHFANELLWWPA